jgi:uncharacterized phage-associated protein
MMASQLRFQFNESKGVEALAYIAGRWAGITAFYASKVLFFAEKIHLNRYCRPIVADTFIAMPNGPVPSTLYDFIKGRLEQSGDPEAIMGALSIKQVPYPRIEAQRPANGDILSQSDMECLEEAMTLCRGKGFAALSSLTHQERAWLDAPQNGPMDYAAMIEGPHRDAVLAEAAEFAAYGVL